LIYLFIILPLTYYIGLTTDLYYDRAVGFAQKHHCQVQNATPSCDVLLFIKQFVMI